MYSLLFLLSLFIFLLFIFLLALTRDDLLDTAHAAAVNLAKADGLGLHQLLENDAVLAVLARGHPDAVRLQRLRQQRQQQGKRGRGRKERVNI